MKEEGWILIGAVLGGVFVGAAAAEILSIKRPKLVKDVEKEALKLGKKVTRSATEVEKKVTSGWKSLRNAFMEGYSQAF